MWRDNDSNKVSALAVTISVISRSQARTRSTISLLAMSNTFSTGSSIATPISPELAINSSQANAIDTSASPTSTSSTIRIIFA